MSSDPFFPETQRKNLWQRLKQIFMLDGGGDFVTILNLTSWTCPQGVYEVYAKLDTGNQILYLNAMNQLARASIVGIWYPCIMQYAVTEFVISGEIGTPGLGDTLLSMTQSTYVSGASTCPDGWRLTSNEVLTVSSGTFDVRYRRIG